MMMERFTIQFVGLKPGTHTFEYLIDDSFFEKREYSLIRKAKVHVGVVLEKQDYSMKISLHIKGEIIIPCDRCTEEMSYPVEDNRTLLVKLADDISEENDELIIVPRNESELNLAQYIYEFINLLLPLKVVHPDTKKGESTCNKEFLAKLAEYSINEPKTDPRWDILKKINLQ